MKLIQQCIAIMLIFSLIGCNGPLRKSLWEKTYYEEKITGFYINEEDSVILISGEKFSYIIECDTKLCDLAQVSRDIEISTYFDDLTLMDDGIVTGEVRFYPAVETHKPIEQALFEQYQEAGLLKKTSSGEVIEKPQKIMFEAKRYNVEGTLPFEVLEKPIDTRILVPDSTIEHAGKMVITPAAIVLDSAYILAITPFALLYFSAYMLSYAQVKDRR